MNENVTQNLGHRIHKQCNEFKVNIYFNFLPLNNWFTQIINNTNENNIQTTIYMDLIKLNHIITSENSTDIYSGIKIYLFNVLFEFYFYYF